MVWQHVIKYVCCEQTGNLREEETRSHTNTYLCCQLAEVRRTLHLLEQWGNQGNEEHPCQQDPAVDLRRTEVLKKKKNFSDSC